MVGARRTIGDEGRLQFVAHIFQPEMLDLPEHLPFQFAIGRAGAEAGQRAARGHRHHRPAPAKHAGVEAQAVGITKAVGEDALAPSLDDGRRAAPPERELHDDEIGIDHAPLLARHVGREAGVPRRMRLFRLVVEDIRIGNAQKIMPASDRVEPLSIKVGNDHVVARLRQRIARTLAHGRVEGGWFGMRVDDQHIHADAQNPTLSAPLSCRISRAS